MKANAKWIPIVLTAASAVGVVGTAVLTAKCTTKAEKMLAGRRENDGNTKETVIDICRCYAPAIACGSITVACIVYNGILTYQQQKALVGACMLARESLTRYQSKVKELYGPEVHNNVIDALIKEDLDDVHITSSGFCSCESLEFEGVSDEEPIHTFYDSFSDRYFDSTIEHVLQAEYHLNRNWMLGADVTVNDFYEFLGLCPLENGDELGWDLETGIQWIDFDHRVVNKNNEKILVIYMTYPPQKSGWIEELN